MTWVEATDGREAWEKYQRETFDLVITDVYMPHMSGVELTQRIRERNSGQKIIVTCSHGDRFAQLERWYPEGLRTLPCPFTTQEVYAAVMELTAGRVRVLIVDDDSSMRELVQLILDGWGVKWVEAVDGTDGLEKYDRDSFDLVITDINMPNMSGVEMIELIRKQNPHQKILVISSMNTRFEYLRSHYPEGLRTLMLPFEVPGLFDCVMGLTGPTARREERG